MSDAPPPYTHKGPPVSKVKDQILSFRPTLSVVIPIRNRYGARVRNCVKSVKTQTQKDVELIIVDYGSSPKNHKELMKTLNPFDCTVYRCPTEAIWSLSIARNIGIRRAKGWYIASLDVDCILESKVVEAIINILKKQPRGFVASRVCWLPKLDLDKIQIPQDFSRLKGQCKYERWGLGALMTTHKEWWHKVRGFDERMRAWGAEDDDIWNRAIKDKLVRTRLENQKIAGTKVFHQWHPESVESHRKQLGIEKYRQLYSVNLQVLHKDKALIRNNETWGATI